VKLLSKVELAGLHTKLVDLLDRSWIQHLTATDGGPWCHTVLVVFARKPDRSWLICYCYLGLTAISGSSMDLLSHTEALFDSTLRSCFFTKLVLASSYHQLWIWA
jgi:hypothetical protein